jgi:voltage-gated potassium channel
VSGSRIRNAWVHQPYLFLLLAMLGNLLIQPLVHYHFGRARLATLIAFMIVLYAAVHATTVKGRLRRVAIGLAWAGLLLAWIDFGVHETGGRAWVLTATMTLRHLFAGGFFALVSVLLMGRALAPGRIDMSRILAAVCAYLLLGILWAEGYALLTVWYGPVLTLPADAGISELMYFSFVTLTTLGYGDILPVHPFARALAYLEAVTGVLYLATLVARLVALQIAHGMTRFSYDEDDSTGDS